MGRITEFTDEEVQQIVERYAHGTGDSQRLIGQEFGVSQSAISVVLRRAGVPCPRRSGAKPGLDHPSWKGGRTINPEGYVLVKPDPEDLPFCTLNSSGYAVEHRLVAGRALGRKLTRKESVHHINGDKTDNRLENLQVRHGQHGIGVVFQCRSCGSHDLEAVPLA